MRALEAIELPNVVVGRLYNVPAVRVSDWWGFAGWLPIIGPKHADAEIIEFPWPHFHVDWRFAPERVFKLVSGSRGPGYVYGAPITDPNLFGQKIILEGPIAKRMQCKRELLPYPGDGGHWQPALAQKYACARLTNGRCPHRGIPVSAMRLAGDVLECPAHGLRWSAITGEAVP